MEKAKESIAKLVEKYDRLKKENKIKDYNEAQTRKDFIDPLFEYLGWDIRNSKNDNEVTTEEKISKDRVDMAFRINGIPKFFLEAKSMKSDLDIESYARQAINYSWNKGVNYAILADFESLKVFNAQAQSKLLSDKLIFEIHCEEYLSDFERLWLLSKKSFENNELDKYAEKYGKRIKKQTVNEKLFDDLKQAREILTKSFIAWNKEKFDKEAIDEGVQRILDRLIFIRVLEDRQLEPPTLKPIINEWEKDKSGNKQLFHMLISKFRELDNIYNSNLFDEHHCEQFEEYDDAVKTAILLLYGSDIYQYDFKEIPADILGGVYESYLGYIAQNPIKVDKEGKSGKLLKFESNSEIKIESRQKRKEHGIYYTPRFIVDYIVKNSLGEKLKEVGNMAELKKIKVLDPACGSGSFLTRALEEINNKYKDFGNPGKQDTKTEIVLSNIYGVDLDSQATELAKLNLLLDTLDEKAKLPSIKNVRVGNSLISGSEKELQKYFGKNWQEKKPFNWEEEFPEVFQQGGFDVIIGNPPYIKEDVEKSAFDGLHGSPYYQGKMDIWTLFACRAIDLLKNNGYFSFIAPSSWLASSGASMFRRKILTDGEIIKFIDFSDFKVFKDASIQTMIFIFQKKKPRKLYETKYIKIIKKDIGIDSVATLLNADAKGTFEFAENYNVIIDPEKIKEGFINFSNNVEAEILQKIESKANLRLLKEDIGNGIDVLQDFISEKHLAKLSDKTIKKGDGVFIISNDYIEKLKLNKLENTYLKPYFSSKQINRYLALKNSEFKIIYADKYFRENIYQFPNLKEHINRFKEILTSAFAPYGLHRPREEKFFKGDAIYLLRKTAYPAFSYVNFPCYVTRAFLVIKTNRINLKYLTAILNSRLMYFWFKNKGKKQGEQLQIDKEPLLDAPILKTNEKNEVEVNFLFEKILDLNLQFKSVPENSDKWNSIKAEIAKTDKTIDQKVYKLYGLTEDEIKIVEGK